MSGAAGSAASSVVRLTLAYDGTDFRGWAKQPDQRTVEGTVSDALSRVLGTVPKLSVAGRTDAGVHARGQVASFPAGGIDVARLQSAVNSMLAPEVVVTDARMVRAPFDARFSATGREYRYRIDVGPWPDPFEARFVWHRPGELSVGAMRRAARELTGEHDFAAFCKAPADGSPTVRRLERLTVARHADRLEIAARASAFLHQMVRSLVGTLVAVGEGRMEPEAIPGIIASRSRAQAGPVAPAHGLTLERVRYGRPAARSR